jgi:hypothetical protein
LIPEEVEKEIFAVVESYFYKYAFESVRSIVSDGYAKKTNSNDT